MTELQIRKILEASQNYQECYEYRRVHPGCPIMRGLVILAKYTTDQLITAAEHDVIYGSTYKELEVMGITEGDLDILRKLGWTGSDGALVHYL